MASPSLAGTPVNMNPVLASIISAIGYDGRAGILYVKFKSVPMTYRYFKVPVEVYDEFLNADGKGLFFNQNIRRKYEYSIVK